ncbi:MAG: phosphoadenosine phosphosulfate reductase family protein [Thermotogae bacterium]|nr:phosphoadenosine phosphosulfate reductase family protein [Thermotogota bacterium]
MVRYSKCGLPAMTVEIKGLGVKCSECGEEEAVVELRYARKKLCRRCFTDFFVRRVKRTVERYRMFGPDDRVAVALSGGKDSVALLDALKRAFPEQDIVAFYIDLGIHHYSEHLREKVEALTDRLKVPLHIYDLKEREGYVIDDFLTTKFRSKMCSVCGIVKRAVFTQMAKEVGATVMATGHNLDDTVGTMLSAFFAGDFESIARLKPVLKPLLPGQPKKIKPLFNTPEIEDLYYVVLNDLPVQECSCPHSFGASVSRYKRMLDEMERDNPNVKFQLLSVFIKRLVPMYERVKALEGEEEAAVEVRPCKVCGLPTSSPDGICSRCRRVAMLKERGGQRLEVSPREVKAMMDEGRRVVLIDVRPESAYEKERIPGSINIPIAEFESRQRKIVRKLRRKYGRGTIFVAYCYAGRESYPVAVAMRRWGLRAYSLEGGIAAWKEAGYSLEESSEAT